MQIKKICIYGVGMMGGSIGISIINHFSNIQISGVVQSEKEQWEISQKKISIEIFTEKNFLKKPNWQDFQLIIFCLPVDQIIKKLKLIPNDYPGIVIDIGSIKTNIMRQAEEVNYSFVGSHPICGSEHSGFLYADGNLFLNKLCSLTKTKRFQSEEIYKKIESFWKLFGMKTIFIDSVEHDKIFSYISHFPHLLTSLMVNWIGKKEIIVNYMKESPTSISGGGLKDMIRIAGSNPTMWQSIFYQNKQNLLIALIEFKEEIDKMIQNIEENKIDWISFIEKAKINKGKVLKDDQKNENI